MAKATGNVVEQLEQALGTGQVPAEAKRRGALLLSRLRSPVQVVLVGHAGTGKSRLVNMLAGETVIPEKTGLPVVEVCNGPEPRIVHLFEDGTEHVAASPDLQVAPPDGTAMVRVETPLKALQRYSLIEVDLGSTEDEQKAAAEWAARRADIVLWCTQDFGEEEHALWSAAPDALKDHSFLVLTKADQLLMKGVLPERIAALEDVVAEEFYSMFPIATIQAISSLGDGGIADEGLWTTSGARALTQAVFKLVETGRNADADNALMFLQRYAPDLPGGFHPPAVSRSSPAVPAPVQNRPEAPKSEPVADRSDLANRSKMFTQALDFLQKRADTLLNSMQENASGEKGFVLDHCMETAKELSEIILEAEESDPSVSDIHDDVMECSDMMVLFQLEKTEDAAEDAVTLLLQLKKDMAKAASEGVGNS